MSHQNTTFQQILQLIPRHDFEKWVEKHKGNGHSKGFNCRSQFAAMLFGQLSSQSGLRGIESGLSMNRSNFHHMGIGEVKRSTLAYANQNRSYEIYQGLFYHMLGKLHGAKKKHKFRFKNPLYSIDASTIDLWLKLFPWAEFRKHKAGIKLHVKLDHSGYIPSFVSVTDAKTHENNAIKAMPFEKGDILVFDKGYSDYEQYSNYCRKGIYFVTRIKRNAKIRKDRWQIEVFFKTIKQNLKIKSFFGTSRNAVLTRIWISMIAFLLLKFLAETSTQNWTVTYLMAVIPILLFMKKDIWIWLNDLDPGPQGGEGSSGQMELGL